MLPDPEVAAENRNQANAWDGPEGQLWADHPDYYDRTVELHHAALMMAAQIGPADRVLDVGCGNGQVAREAARLATRGTVTGIDISAAMVATAKLIATRSRIENLEFLRGDAQVYPFPEQSYDIVLSRFGAMFFGDQLAAFTNLRRSLVPTGRLAMISWRSTPENEWFLRVADALTLGRGLPDVPAKAPGPFRHANADDVREILDASGFVAIDIEPVEAPMTFGSTVAEAATRMSAQLQWMLDEHDKDDRLRAEGRLRSVLTEQLTGAGVLLGSAAWLITAANR